MYTPLWKKWKQIGQEQIEDMQNQPTTERDRDQHRNPNVDIGARVRKSPAKHPATVMFVQYGIEGFPAGWWIGLKHEHAVGSIDWCVAGKRYFSTPRNRGEFLRPSQIEKVSDSSGRVSQTR